MGGEWGEGSFDNVHYMPRPANLATPKTLRLGCLVRVSTIELLASHTHCRRSTILSQKLHQYYPVSLAQLMYARFSVMNMQPSSTVSKYR